MRLFFTVPYCVFFATSISATSLTIPVLKASGKGEYLKGAPAADRARAASFGNVPIDSPVSNFYYSTYVASVGIGSPPTHYNLIVDTGSSNTFCGAGPPYVRTSTSIPTGQAVNITHHSGDITGLEYLDQVTLAPNLVIKNQSIGGVLDYTGFIGVDGILGLGPIGLTRGTLSPDQNATIPTVMDNLVSQGLIKEKVFGVYFAPPREFYDTNGALIFGGLDSSLYRGEVTYVPLTETFPASNYWGINITSVTYGDHNVLNASTAGVVDTGTATVLLAEEAFRVYMNAIPNATFDNNLGLIEIPDSSVETLQPLHFHIGSSVLTMDPAAQLVPKYQVAAWGGVPGKNYIIVSTMGANSGGIGFALGQKFMERFYTVFDADARRIGFAHTNNTCSPQEG